MMAQNAANKHETENSPRLACFGIAGAIKTTPTVTMKILSLNLVIQERGDKRKRDTVTMSNKEADRLDRLGS